MTEMFLSPVHMPTAWRGPELADDPSWIYTLTQVDLAELNGALAVARSRGRNVEDITRDDFPLPRFSQTLMRLLHEIEGGRGFCLIRGLPVERLGERDASAIYWGMGLHMGEVAPQNMRGERLGHVRAAGKSDWNADPTVRGYHTAAGLPFHSDKSDVVGLLCLHAAKEGGLSCIASSVAIHNEILATRPDLHAALYAPFYVDHRGEELDGEKPYYVYPIFSVYKGKLFARFGIQYIKSAQRIPEVPRLTDAQLEALTLFNELAKSDAFRLNMEFRPGDIQLLSNHAIVHSRTDYIDFPEPERRRHLLRLLLFTRPETDIPPCVREVRRFMRAWGERPRAHAL